MSTDETSQLFPMLPGAESSFEVAMRGYDRHQVDDYVARTEAEIHALNGERDAALARSADLAAQLANAQAQIEASRRQLAEATTAITPETVHARLRPLVENAHAEARQIRQSADTDAQRVRALADADAQETRRQADEDAETARAQAQQDLQRATQAATKREQEADETLARAQTAAAETLNKSRTDATKLLSDADREVTEMMAEATETRRRLDAQAAASRLTATEDFEIALRVRRGEEMRVDDKRRGTAAEQAKSLVSDATEEAERMLADARAELQFLRDARNRARVDLHEIHHQMGVVLGSVDDSEARDASHTFPPPGYTDYGDDYADDDERSGGPA